MIVRPEKSDKRKSGGPTPRFEVFGDNVHIGEVPNVAKFSRRKKAHRRNRKAVPEFEGPMNIDIIGTLCTEELLHELDEWLPTARVCYPKAKLVISTDVPLKRVEEIARRLNVKNVKVRKFDRKRAIENSKNIPLYSPHWKPETIWGKLDETRTSVETYRGAGVMFADTDITFVRPIDRSFHADVVLSPAFCGDLQRKTSLLTQPDQKIPLFRRDGLFNAGMWLTRSFEFMDWWIKAVEMSGGDSFLEQTSLEYAPGGFITDYLDSRDNFGKWRFQAPPPDVRSVHYHINERSRWIEDTEIKRIGQAAAAEARIKLGSK